MSFDRSCNKRPLTRSDIQGEAATHHRPCQRYYFGDTSNPSRFATFYYTSRDEIDHVVLGDSLQIVDYTYNPRGWLNTINDGSSDTSAAGDLFGEQLYYYDYPGQAWSGEKNGNIMAQKISMAGTDQVRHYGYDDIDRLISVTELDSSLESGLESFSYDGNGNRLSYQQIVGEDTNSTAYSYRSPGNILESLSSTTGNRSFGWDDNGNMVSDSRLGMLGHLYCDLFNQLKEARWTNLIGDDYIKFGYNVGGERVYKEYKYYYRDICDGHVWEPPGGFLLAGDDSLGVTTLSSGTLPPDDTLCIFSKTTYTRYVVSKGKVLAEYDGSSGTSREFTFIYAGNQRIAMIDKDGKLHFYLNDHLGSARLVIDTAGTVKDNYDYYAFGEALDQTISTGQSYGYTGKPFDNDHGLNLHYYGARYYDGTTGRFISVDPLAFLDFSNNPYQFCLANPVNFYDPDGLSTHTDSSGNVVAVYNDDDNGVYRHDKLPEKYAQDDSSTDDKLSGGEKMGETEHWDEFIDPEKGGIMKTRIMFGESWNPTIDAIAEISDGADLRDIATLSSGGGYFDIKHGRTGEARLLNGKYASSRSAGDYLAGYNAAGGTLFGCPITFDLFQRLAGALHVRDNNLTKVEMALIVTFGLFYGPPPAYGENMYQYRMSKMGWDVRTARPGR